MNLHIKLYKILAVGSIGSESPQVCNTHTPMVYQENQSHLIMVLQTTIVYRPIKRQHTFFPPVSAAEGMGSVPSVSVSALLAERFEVQTRHRSFIVWYSYI